MDENTTTVKPTASAWTQKGWTTAVRKFKIGATCLSKCPHLSIKHYQHWFDAILGDNEVALLQTIKDTNNWQNLVNGHFMYGDGALMKKAQRGQCSAVKLPLAVAAVAGATNSILTLLQAGVSPQQVDCHGNNVVHSMIAFLHYNRDMEDTIISKFQLLVDTVSVDVMREILHHENSFGLRPIEFAAQHGQGKMVISIMSTPGVYMTKQQVVGLTCYKWYNITEYESTGSGSRSDKSPLRLMTYADEEYVDSLCEFAGHNIIKAWYKKKFLLNLPLIVPWALIRTLSVVVFAVIDLDMSYMSEKGANSTACIPSGAIMLTENIRTTLLLYLFVYAVLAMCMSGKMILKSHKAYRTYLMYTLSGGKKLVLQKFLYEVSYLCLCLIILVTVPMMYFEANVNLGIMDYVRVITPFLACWCCFYFVQVLPGIGFFIVSIYSMMRNLVLLIIVYFLMIAPFLQSFYNFMNTNSLQGCIKGYSTFLEVVYSLFQIMLNMVNLLDYDIVNATLLHITHMSYIFFVAVMLINFFIAVMTDAVGKVYKIHTTAITIQRADMAFSMEMLWSGILSRYYKTVRQKVFDYEEDELVLIDSSTQL